MIRKADSLMRQALERTAVGEDVGKFRNPFGGIAQRLWERMLQDVWK